MRIISFQLSARALALAFFWANFSSVAVWADATAQPLPVANPAVSGQAFIYPDPNAMPEAQWVQPTPASTFAQAEKLVAESLEAAQPTINLMSGLHVEGWDAEPMTVLIGRGDSFVTANGFRLDEAGGHPGPALREFGCRHVVTRKFSRTQRPVIITVFCFQDAKGAFGAYSTMRDGSSTVVLRGDASSEDDNTISFWKGNYLIKLRTFAEDDDSSKQTISRLADQLAASIPAGAPVPALIARLPALDRVAGSERLLMGPVVARRYAFLPYLNVLALDRSKGAAFADYQFPQPQAERLKLLIVDYGDPALAANIYSGYLAAVSAGHKPQVQSLTSGMFKLQDGYMFLRLRGNQVAIISGARHRLSPLMLARQISQ